MAYAIIFVVGLIFGQIITGWLFMSKIEKYLATKEWLYTANLYKDSKLIGWHSGIMALGSEPTLTDILNYIIKESNKLGKDTDTASLVMFTRWIK